MAPETQSPSLSESGEGREGESALILTVQGITKISDLTSCANLSVLYLYNNKLKSIEVRGLTLSLRLIILIRPWSRLLTFSCSTSRTTRSPG